MNFKDLIKKLYSEKRAMLAYNAPTLDCAHQICEFSFKNNMPLVIQTSERVAEYYGASAWVSVARAFNQSKVQKVFLNLDHSNNLELVKNCLKAGYDSVMFDGSGLSLDKNINLTKKVVKLAHEYDCLVEGEVGELEELSQNSKAFLTQVQEAQKFVKETDVDLLAPTFGNAHGHYKVSKNRLDFNLLQEVFENVPVPLVLHGGSGLTKEEINRCISLGVVKVNVSTDLKEAFNNAFNQFDKSEAKKGEFYFKKVLDSEYGKVFVKYKKII